MGPQVDDLERVEWRWREGEPPVVFDVRPLTIYERIEIDERLATHGPPAGDADARRIAAITDVVVSRVVYWTGIYSGSEPAPCTEENKRRVFGRLGQAWALVWACLLGGRGDVDRPNGSGGGSDSASPTPASPVASGTSTETAAPATPAGAAVVVPGSIG